MKRFLPLALMLGLTLMFPSGMRAQDATPGVGGCTADPMPPARIQALAALAATPPASPRESTAATDLSGGTPIDAATRDALNQVLQQVQQCAWQQDLPRLLSLYTDRFIVEQFFADEPVAIVRTTIGTPTSATPAPMATDQQQFVMDAARLPDGRIVAIVSGNAWGGNARLYFFAQQDGRWLIDAIGPVPSDLVLGGIGGVAIPAEAQSVVDRVLQDAATRLSVDPSTLVVESIEAVDWPDSALGCPEEGGVYAQVISPGYRIIIKSGTTTLEYHTGTNDLFVTC